MNWNPFKRKPTPPEIKVRLIPSTEITLAQWRSSPSLTTAAVNLQNVETYRLAMEVLRNEHPVHQVMTSFGVNATDRIVAQAKCEGYELALNTLASLSKPAKLASRIDTAWEKPPSETTET